MRATITCTACGSVLGVPKDGVPAGGLSCNWCGCVNLQATAPAPAPAPAPTAKPAPEPVTAAGTPAEPAPVRHRWADDDDDNGQPYAPVTDEVKTRKCEACGKDIDLLAVVCVHCGFDAQAKKKIERTFAPVDRTWVSGWPLERRMTLFVAFQVMNVITLVISVAGDGSLPTSLVGVIFAVAVQAFVIGTFDTLRVRRNKKGQAVITIMWRVGFFPMEAKKVPWKEHEGVAFGHYDPTGLSDWWIFFVLFPWGIVPAILWWYYMMRPDHFFAALARDRGFPETYLYRGKSEPQAKEICQVVTDVTALPLVTKI
jgi:hypothetical protein